MNLDDWITSSDRYPERADSKELTKEVLKNADEFLARVAGLLRELGVDTLKLKVSSGFRPSHVNAGIPNAAKRSLHMIGKAVDLRDPGNKIDELVSERYQLLDRFGLWLESPICTPGWCHLDCGVRVPRAKRIFIP